MSEKIKRCTAVIFKRDAYRYTGGKRGFQLHYTETQCSHRAVVGSRCRKHPIERGFGEYRNAKEFKD